VQFQGVQQVAVKDLVENSKSIEVQDKGASLWYGDAGYWLLLLVGT